MPKHGGAMTLPGDKSDKFGKFIFWRRISAPEFVVELDRTLPLFALDSSNEFSSRLGSTIFLALTQGVSGS